MACLLEVLFPLGKDVSLDGAGSSAEVHFVFSCARKETPSQTKIN